MGLFAVDHEHRPTDPSADGCCLGKSQCVCAPNVLPKPQTWSSIPHRLFFSVFASL